MARSKLLDYVHTDSLMENVLHQMVSNNLPIDATTWQNALPTGSIAGVIKLKSVYTEPVYGSSDFSMKTSINLFGDFQKVAGEWEGAVTKVQMFKDGKLVAKIKVNSGVDLDELISVENSGVIWDLLTSSGLKGNLSDQSDYFIASDGSDIIKGGLGHDWIFGHEGNDRLYGGAGRDTLEGMNGNDVLYGGGGRDTLNGLSGDDRLFGGKGRDTFVADTIGSKDVWTGGAGADFFEISGLFRDGAYGVTVADFNRSGGDKVDLRGDDSFIFNTYSEIRYIGDQDFSGDAGVYEVRMEGGLVSVDNNSDGFADREIMLDGLDSFGVQSQNWLKLPDGLDFI